MEKTINSLLKILKRFLVIGICMMKMKLKSLVR